MGGQCRNFAYLQVNHIETESSNYLHVFLVLIRTVSIIDKDAHFVLLAVLEERQVI